MAIRKQNLVLGMPGIQGRSLPPPIALVKINPTVRYHIPPPEMPGPPKDPMEGSARAPAVPLPAALPDMAKEPAFVGVPIIFPRLLFPTIDYRYLPQGRGGGQVRQSRSFREGLPVVLHGEGHSILRLGRRGRQGVLGRVPYLILGRKEQGFGNGGSRLLFREPVLAESKADRCQPRQPNQPPASAHLDLLISVPAFDVSLPFQRSLLTLISTKEVGPGGV